MTKIFIDGSAGTTGLRIRERLGAREDLTLLSLPDELRKDPAAKKEILKQADEKITLSEHYFRGCMQQRDRYMADRADVLIIYQRTEVGGTAFTAKYFYKKYPFKRRIFL